MVEREGSGEGEGKDLRKGKGKAGVLSDASLAVEDGDIGRRGSSLESDCTPGGAGRRVSALIVNQPQPQLPSPLASPGGTTAG